MPMYHRKPEEWRQAAEETRVDIAHWAGLDEDMVTPGFYYSERGSWMIPKDFEEEYEEVE